MTASTKIPASAPRALRGKKMFSRRLRIGALAALALGLSGIWRAGLHAQSAGDELELVDPHVFRACADPRNLPFSDEAGEGFENKIAELMSKKLGKGLAYTFYPGATGFIRNTLNARRCDVVLGIPLEDDFVQPTNPYYRTAYVAAYPKEGPLAGLDSLSDPRLKTVKIGVIAGTPPATYLAVNGLLPQIKSYALVVDTRYDSPNAEMMGDLEKGVIDVALMWGPIAGYYASKTHTAMTVAPLLKETGGPKLVYRISMGVRRSDQNWKRDLNKLLSQNRAEINKILLAYGVPLLDENDKPLAAP